MKKILIVVTTMFLSSNMMFAQNDKSELVNAVENKHYWLSSEMVDKFINVNVSPEIWTKIISEPNRPVGITSFGNLGLGISKFLDNTSDKTLNKMCGFSVASDKAKSNRPICEDQIKEAFGKINVTVNAKSVRLTEDSYMLLMKAVGQIYYYLGKTEGNTGWKPKGKTLSFVVNTGTSEKDLGAKWNPDFSVFTITTSPYIEVPGWSDKLENVFKKGVNNY